MAVVDLGCLEFEFELLAIWAILLATEELNLFGPWWWLPSLLLMWAAFIS